MFKSLEKWKGHPNARDHHHSLQPLETKFFEIRDTGTFIPAVGIKMDYKGKSPQECFLLKTSGYGHDNPLIMLVLIEINACHYDCYEWGDRTRQIAHKYIQENFDSLESGSVIDVEFILGETLKPKEATLLSYYIRSNDFKFKDEG